MRLNLKPKQRFTKGSPDTCALNQNGDILLIDTGENRVYRNNSFLLVWGRLAETLGPSATHTHFIFYTGTQNKVSDWSFFYSALLNHQLAF